MTIMSLYGPNQLNKINCFTEILLWIVIVIINLQVTRRVARSLCNSWESYTNTTSCGVQSGLPIVPFQASQLMKWAASYMILISSYSSAELRSTLITPRLLYANASCRTSKQPIFLLCENNCASSRAVGNHRQTADLFTSLSLNELN